MPKTNTISSFFLISLIGGCGSLSEWKSDIVRSPAWFEGTDHPASASPQPQVQAPRRPQWNPQALRVHSGAISVAKDRWPWAEGYQLQRRAQILQLGPDFSALQTLDSSSDATHEIHILRQLLEQRQKWALKSN